ncbi:hypothetical protein BBI15_06115 [Planococcus plakortidis]|uniref:2'-5' RNA ligase n=1 Tax=Planococcus plakortidis TaxID=1038856 RepID=A0A1C7E7Y0_9BACL|nr:hypothetical protein [Planococcus plakortidis]ANU19816.1 hypothetical protein BBI15_06115 [Planococcus plakortidis]
MQLLVLRLDYRSSTTIESLQRQLRQPNSKLALQLPHIPLLAYQNTSPLQLKATFEPIAKQAAVPSFHASDIGFSKEGARFYLQVQPEETLNELHSSLKLAGHEFSAASPGNPWQPRIPLIGQVPAPFWGPLFARLALEFSSLEGIGAALECWTVIGHRTSIEWSIFLDS